MTENLLQKLEEKTMTILAELEKLRGEVKNLKQENASLRTEKETSSRKLNDLVSLLESSAAESTEQASFLQEAVA